MAVCDPAVVPTSTLKATSAKGLLTFSSTQLPTDYADSTTTSHVSTATTGENDALAFLLASLFIWLHMSSHYIVATHPAVGRLSTSAATTAYESVALGTTRPCSTFRISTTGSPVSTVATGEMHRATPPCVATIVNSEARHFFAKCDT